MTDELGRLRQAMTDLAEHGGHADLYARTLRRSRRTQRRTRLATAGAAAAAVFAVGGTVAYATAHRPAPPVTPPATQTPAPSPTTAPSPSPTSVAPSETPASPRSSTPTGNRPRYPHCPSAKTLERLTDLPEDWSFVPSSVSCRRNWATAAPQGPSPGDGVYLFHYKAGTGWRYHSQGSGFSCQDLGITAGNPPFCERD